MSTPASVTPAGATKFTVRPPAPSSTTDVGAPYGGSPAVPVKVDDAAKFVEFPTEYGELIARLYVPATAAVFSVRNPCGKPMNAVPPPERPLRSCGYAGG